MKLTEEIIRSRKNPCVIWAASLADKKVRDRDAVFIADGVKLFAEATSAGLSVTRVFVAESESERLLPFISEKLASEVYRNTVVTRLSDECFEKISQEKAPQGLITVIKHLDFFKKCTIINNNEPILHPEERTIMLYAMRDPGNLGSVIRSAVAFGADHILMSADCADIYNPKTVRAAMGSLFRVRMTSFTNVPEMVKAVRCSGRRVFAAELSEHAVSLTEAGLLPHDAVMIGNEGHGIPREISAVCDGSVYIPISKATESLNAAVAAAIFMWEQQKHGS